MGVTGNKVIMLKREASAITGGLTQTSKMPCKSYSLPTLACQTGYKLAQIEGTICSKCYADRGFYALYSNTIEPAQVARLSSLDDPHWVGAMVVQILGDPYFRWHDSGDIQSVEHLHLIVLVCWATPDTEHWLPTREVGFVIAYINLYGRDALPPNLIIRISATYPDRPVKLPPALLGIPTILTSNVHTPGQPALGLACEAYTRGGACGECRACWSPAVPAVSYPQH